MSKRLHLINQTFGRLDVLDDGTIQRSASGRAYRYYLCRCSCNGKTIRIQGHNLTSGSIKSCGCLKAERAGKLKETHGARGSAQTQKQKCIYKSWIAMKDRCFNPENKDFKDYGGREIPIQVCAQWDIGFRIFWRDMEATWFPGATINRIDNDNHYNRKNCEWATRKQQGQNTRRNVKWAQEEVDWLHVYANQLNWSLRLMAECRGVARKTLERVLLKPGRTLGVSPDGTGVGKMSAKPFALLITWGSWLERHAPQ